MDLHRGDIVEEWKAGSRTNFKIRNLATRSKYAQLTDEKLVCGISNNGLFLLDQRINRSNKMTNEKFYKSKSPEFSCLATNGEGHVAIGSKCVNIRLYSGIDKNRSENKPCWIRIFHK